MKRNGKKVLALLLGVIMVTGLLAGCGAKGGNGSSSAENESNAVSDASGSSGNVQESNTGDNALDTSEHVDIVMYLVGDTPETYDDILAKVNEITEREINASLTVEWLSWSEHDTKYSLLFSGNEDFDLIFTAPSWCHYEQTVALGGFQELTEELISTYMPDVWEQWPEAAWNQAKIDGKIYMMPSNWVEFNPTAMGIRTDLMEKYNYSDITSWDELISFLNDCAADGMNAFTVKDNNLWGVYDSCDAYGYTGLTGTPNSGSLIYYKAMDPDDTKVVSIFDRGDFNEYCHTMQDLAKAGGIPDDVVGNSTEERQTGLANGKAALCAWNTGTIQIYANEINAAHPEYKVQIFDLFKDNTYPSTKYTNNAIGVNANTKHLERTLMMLNLLATNQEIMDLTGLGIQGVNWELNEDGTYSVLQEYVPSNWWGWRNGNLVRTLYNPAATEVDEKYNQLNERYRENAKPEHMLDYFGFDATPVSTQFAAVEAALDTYWYPLLCGQVDDVDKTIEQFKAAMDTAGFQDILDEAQKQVDSYMANLN